MTKEICVWANFLSHVLRRIRVAVARPKVPIFGFDLGEKETSRSSEGHQG